MTRRPSLIAFLISGVPEMSPTIYMPGALVSSRGSRCGTLRAGIFLVVLMTMHDFGLVGHSTWHAVSSMH